MLKSSIKSFIYFTLGLCVCLLRFPGATTCTRTGNQLGPNMFHKRSKDSHTTLWPVLLQIQIQCFHEALLLSFSKDINELFYQETNYNTLEKMCWQQHKTYEHFHHTETSTANTDTTTTTREGETSPVRSCQKIRVKRVFQ